MFQVRISWVVEVGIASRIGAVSRWNYDHHALTSTGQEDAIGVLLKHLAFSLPDTLPPIAFEGPILPTIGTVAEISIPGDANPVEFEALHVKLGGYVLQVVRRSNMLLAVQEPRDGVHRRFDVNSVWFQALCL